MRPVSSLVRLSTAVVAAAGLAAFIEPFDDGSMLDRAYASGPAAPPQATRDESVGWPMHNIDPCNSRFAPLDDINTPNAKRLGLKREQTIRQVTPLVVDGLTHFNSVPRADVLEGICEC
jgi:glucose dehydrogenase